MSEYFTGKAIPKGVSLPADMWAYLEQRRKQMGIPVSVQILRALERDVLEAVSKRRARTLVDPGVPYEVEKETA